MLRGAAANWAAPGPIGSTTPSSGTFTFVSVTGSSLDGTGGSAGIYRPSSSVLGFFTNGALVAVFSGSAGLQVGSSQVLGFTNGVANGTPDAAIARASANSMRFGSTSATTTSRTELNVAVAAIANAVATDVLTVTIPNAAHSASLKVRVTGSLGAGGAIGANEATATNEYTIAITRTAGVVTAVAISAASGAAASAVAGAATVTCTAALSAVSGAAGATNSFTVQATISRSAGSSTNHTCLVYAQLMNANATGITIA